ncbi:unnamed protein product [Bursaphelenchus xylophilus]|uniref:(pine wood nematode) hypothetical protein n=1 Tax=Bursaphelenchus xylophilus TaxID=6326 RepID=A0A1I7SVY1_BURXY|nr:unnamed protein product [Bursaphelenchus xylophilus]CAG9098487.1 unnamed protein product [Bursaphelenchus xylophilus]
MSLLSVSPVDCCIRILFLDDDKNLKEEPVYAHRQVLAKSPYLFALLQQSSLLSPSNFSLDLSLIERPVDSFKTILAYLYTGQLADCGVSQQSLHFLARLLQLPGLQRHFSFKEMSDCPSKPEPQDSADTPDLNPLQLPTLHPALCAAYLSLLQNQQNAQLLQGFLQQAQANMQLLASQAHPRSSIFPPTPKPVTPLTEMRISESEQSEAPSVASSCSTGSNNPPSVPSSSPTDNLNDILVPSNEKEGWCRNKKYIQTVQKGYRCTVCNKVYGRYNSVSYHVTIYHRNPPIKCEEQGCQFTTREARYIHFHKYYRHGVPLPESIDLASRKCPFFSCKHVSKSPAMLDKHINRHVADCTKDGHSYNCPKCNYSTTEQREMFSHLRAHQLGTEIPEMGGPIKGVKLECDQCNFKATTESGLEKHKSSKHGQSEMSSPLQFNGIDLATALKSLPAFQNNFLSHFNR